ncbi:MAG: M20 family metallopeptidase [Klebsiella huaxiensis]|uniref:M20 aminoacylase family protein n=1 Tax=Klebsiella huaxiensis TaxID=2153354 RepID=UPI0026F1687F|nr:M20 aminoacylase family protein [Klebsiella huaxiensis]WEJ90378.1 MAG: M20 family metallopeptidase [Klebsiella huaxiensis]
MNNQDFANQLTEWRHYLHTIPGTGFDISETESFVANRLAELGIETHRGVGKNGLVGVIRKGTSQRAIGLRADMDALNIKENTGLPYSSQNEGKMHACGHDGHTSMLLGAAQLLREDIDFNGTVYLIFQPDEENGQGAKEMIAAGLFEKFPMDEIYGIHNMPGMPAGSFATRAGGIMASEDNFIIRIHAKGSHAARPHMGHDPLVIAAEIILALQTIVARNLDPALSAVISCTQIHSDGIRNTIPGFVEIKGDTRSYDPEVQELIETRMRKICNSICMMHDAECEFIYTHEFSPTVNSKIHKQYALAAATAIFPADKINGNVMPMMTSEDFGAFLEKTPGCFVFIGNGTETDGKGYLPLHNSGYDFNDDILESGARFFAELTRMRLMPL